MDVKILKVSP